MPTATQDDAELASQAILEWRAIPKIRAEFGTMARYHNYLEGVKSGRLSAFAGVYTAAPPWTPRAPIVPRIPFDPATAADPKLAARAIREFKVSQEIETQFQEPRRYYEYLEEVRDGGLGPVGRGQHAAAATPT